MSKEEYDFKNAKQEPVVKPSANKTRITIRIDTDILNWFREQVNKESGGNYQTLINEALREYKNLKDHDFEDTLRKVIREELKVISK
ncbi:MAG: CopG family transcriptional regulator [Spirochaetes bacterium]|nr:MAG: CopG family transcriptional regulator [Spirochaetota bacterium]